MKKVIRITESELVGVVRKVLSEMPMGVPHNITETATQIYYSIIQKFTNIFDLSAANENSYQISISGNFHVGDYNFTSTTVKFTFAEYIDEYGDNPPDLIGAAVGNKAKVVNNKTHDEVDNNIQLIVRFSVGENWNLGMLIDVLKENRSKLISMLAHELFHQFEHYKYPSRPATRKASYDAIQGIRIERVQPLNYFLHLLYFIHETERYTRPSEFYGALKANNITKEQFKDFFKNNDVVQTLRECRDYTFHGLVSNLRNHMEEIDEFLSEIKNQGAPDINLSASASEKINLTLKYFHIVLTNKKIDEYISILQSGINPFSSMFSEFLGGGDDEIEKSQQYLDEFVIKLKKFKNHEDFFEDSIKKINFVGETTIKKLSKLYAMVDNDKNSIVNWELHHKINRTAEKTRESLSELLKDGPYKINEKKR